MYACVLVQLQQQSHVRRPLFLLIAGFYHWGMDTTDLDERLDPGASMLVAEPSSDRLPSAAQNDSKRDHATATGDSSSSETRKRTKKERTPVIPSKRMSSEMLQLRRSVQQCCAADDLPTAMTFFEMAATSASTKCLLEPQTLYNLLNLCGGLSDRGIHVGTPYKNPPNRTAQAIQSASSTSVQRGSEKLHKTATQELDIECRQRHAERIMSHMKAWQIPLTESCHTAMIKLFSKAGRFDRAEALLDDAERTQQCRPRLRLYSPLLMRYCEEGQVVPALRVWLRLTRRNLTLTEREYAGLLQCACRTGDAAFMERVLSELAEEILVPCCDTRQAIEKWFQSPAAQVSSSSSDPEVLALLSQIPLTYPYPVEPLGPIVADVLWTVSTGCQTDPQGVLLSGCLKGERLRPVSVSSQICDELMQMNESIVTSGRVEGDQSEFQGGRKGRKKDVDDAARILRIEKWKQLQDYLCKRGKIDVVVDGANVGYFETNFAGAPKHVDYQQIDWIVQHFERQEKSVVVFLHARHVSAPLMPASAAPLVASWRQRNRLYTTPPNMNDDWFWLHAALVTGALVVTNDEMRDHHFQMLAPRGFLRWKDRRQVRFRFGPWQGGSGPPDNGCDNDVDAPAVSNSRRRYRAVLLTYPEAYSRRIQRVRDGLAVPLPKRGDENRFLDGKHQADDDGTPEEETYLCVRPQCCQ